MHRSLTLAVSALLGLSAASAQTLQISSDFIVKALPTPEAIEENPAEQLYADVLQAWLDEHPGVSVESSAVNIWDQQVIYTAIAGGTAPTYYSPGLLGNWEDEGTFAVFKQGLAADLTEAMATYSVNDKIADYVKPLWERWEVDGSYYALPLAYRPGNGVYYRKDLIAEKGLEEPQPGWTWDDYRELAAALTDDFMKGSAMIQWNFETELTGANQFSLLSRIPDPESPWNWRYDFTSRMDLWEPIITAWRGMIYEDESVLTNAQDDGETRNAFTRGEVAMMLNNPSFFTGPPSQDTSMAALADRLGKPVEEVVGWVEMPVGPMGSFGSTQPFISAASVNPDASSAEVDLAVSLYEYMFLGDGYVEQRQQMWEEHEDLRYVYNAPFPVSPMGMEGIPGVPGDFADTWGEAFTQSLESAANLPVIPNTATYITPEAEVGPDDTALQDALNTLIFTEGDVDIEAQLRRAEEVMNQQAQSFSSSLSDEEFVAGARAYYAALDAFWQEHAPEWHAQVYTPWYTELVAPALGEGDTAQR